MNFEELKKAILMGDFDADLDKLARAVRARQEADRAGQVAMLKGTLEQGDRVRIKKDAPINPAYLRGVECRVNKVNRTRVSCEVVDKTLLRSTRFAVGFTIPLKCVELA